MNNIKKDDKVRFIGIDKPLYNKDGLEMYALLKEGEIYTVKDSLIVGIYLEEVEGMFLKEHFRVVEFLYEFICKDCREDFASKDPKSNCAACSSRNVKRLN